MQYMLLIYSQGQAPNDEARAQCEKASMELAQELQTRGQFVAAAPLQPVSTATTVRMAEGKRMVTDGPFAETREQLGGFYIVDANNLDEAIEIASRIPAAKWGSVEIRPIRQIAGLPAARSAAS